MDVAHGVLVQGDAGERALSMRLPVERCSWPKPARDRMRDSPCRRNLAAFRLRCLASHVEPLQLIQAKFPDSKNVSERVNYLVQIDSARVQKIFGMRDELAAFSFAISTAQAVVARAFTGRALVWDAPAVSTGEAPTYDPLYDKDGVKLWIVPVVQKDEAYLYLVG